MGTKTEEYLRILAEGGDAPTDCCMTNTQALIAEAIDRINNLQPGGGGAIVPLSDYLDPQTLTITDREGLISAIEDGKGFYMEDPTSGNASLILNGQIDDDTIKFASYPFLADSLLTAAAFAFDKNTGEPDPTQTNVAAFRFPNSTTSGTLTSLGLGKLTINIGSNTYEYDGSQDVNITIADGENMGF